jgi:hypothetical protein
MSAGYGRGYYGEGQLAQDPARRRGSIWGKVAFVVGAGAVIWLMWPRTPKLEQDEPPPPAPPRPDVEAQPLPAPQLQLSAQHHLSQGVEACGYPGQRAYEDGVVASARQLQAAGAKVVLAPHLAHLASRLEP